MTEQLTKEDIQQWFMQLQDQICSALETADGQGIFRTDVWDRPGGGGGRSRILTDGKIIEKGGVNFSAVWGKSPEAAIKSLNLPPGDVPDFFATGVSIVLHPHNPYVPIIHMNVRYFEMTNGVWWFGGGIDLTPHYVDPNDATDFHGVLKSVCDKHDPGYYEKFKAWADDYFFIRHRNETRGVGGIFFDHLKDDGSFTKSSRFAFVKDVGLAFADIYSKFMRSKHQTPFGEREKQWQLLRRGRYVEFNLVWDRGTKFGLETDGRTESILMSLPPMATWEYNQQPAAGSPEAQTLKYLVKGLKWVK